MRSRWPVTKKFSVFILSLLSNTFILADDVQIPHDLFPCSCFKLSQLEFNSSTSERRLRRGISPVKSVLRLRF
jgi:hypothetical protein